MMLLQYFVLLALSWSSALAADNATNHIYSPGDSDASAQGDIIWRAGNDYTLNWTTSTEQPYTFSLWQALPGTGTANWIQYVYTTNPRPGNNSISWTCTPGSADLLRSSLFYMQLTAADVSISSHSFNITVGPSSRTSSLSSSSTTSSTTAGSISASATSTSNTDSASNVDSGVVKVALGVGLGIGIPLVLLATIWLGFVIYRQNHRNRVLKPSADLSEDGSWSGYHQVMQHDQPGMSMIPVYEKHAEQGISEVPAHREPAELAVDTRR
ncbi:hypothetical protein AMS68_002859 [Peltaster fructicola]|uniref:Mid2 domain-containing protein n=1 Tax=Peltaster fructicola TaxID=286661 RepID=A0A6H0XRF1_9PEZI|nr:hypothetical protein AMS68_002859 [Peltaster fructicola]